jgi:hypothetical protein
VSTCGRYARGECATLCQPYCAHFADSPAMDTEALIRETADTLVEAAPEARKSEVRAASITFINDVHAALCT